MGKDFVTGAAVCIDAKGGIAQACCAGDPNVSCQPSSSGALTLTGAAIPPEPAWPDPKYPKTTGCTPGNCTVQVATFCEAATGNATVDGVTGLPGPGLIILPTLTEWRTP